MFRTRRLLWTFWFIVAVFSFCVLIQIVGNKGLRDFQTDDADAELSRQTEYPAYGAASSVDAVSSVDPTARVSQICGMRPNRTNPWVDLDHYLCPVETDVGWMRHKNRGEQLPISTWKPDYSSVECNAQRHCVYRNICIRGERQVLFFHQAGATPPNLEGFGWRRYRDGGYRTTFSYHYQLSVEQGLPPRNRFVQGTSIWYDQSWDMMNHPGHSSEFYFKLSELREAFPGPVDRILYAADTEVPRGAPRAYTMGFLACHFMRIGFPDRNFKFPPVYWLEQPLDINAMDFRKWLPWHSSSLCFEKVLVPSNQKQHFNSPEAADLHRTNALKMCNIAPRPPNVNRNFSLAPDAPESARPRVFYWNRGFDRKLVNAEQSCLDMRRDGYASYAESDDQPDFCLQLASIHSADIIVAMDGSSNYVFPYANPGSVVILIYPFNFRIPDWKTLTYYSRLRILELIAVNRTWSIRRDGEEVPRWPIYEWKHASLDTPFHQCIKAFDCRYSLKDRDVYIPPEIINAYVQEAVRLLSEPYTVPACQVPHEWPREIKHPSDHWSQYGYETNYEVCEPADPNCVCCKHPDCDRAVRILDDVISESE